MWLKASHYNIVSLCGVVQTDTTETKWPKSDKCQALSLLFLLQSEFSYCDQPPVLLSKPQNSCWTMRFDFFVPPPKNLCSTTMQLRFFLFLFSFCCKKFRQADKTEVLFICPPPNRSLKIIYCVEFQWNVYSQYSLPVLYIILSMSSSSRVEEWSNERLLVSLFSGFVNSGMHNHTSNLHFHILPPSHFLVCSITLSKSAPKSITGFPHSLDRLGWSKPQHNSHAGLGASQVLSSSSAPLLGEN